MQHGLRRRGQGWCRGFDWPFRLGCVVGKKDHPEGPNHDVSHHESADEAHTTAPTHGTRLYGTPKELHVLCHGESASETPDDAWADWLCYQGGMGTFSRSRDTRCDLTRDRARGLLSTRSRLWTSRRSSTLPAFRSWSVFSLTGWGGLSDEDRVKRLAAEFGEEGKGTMISETLAATPVPPEFSGIFCGFNIMV
jgi:hypothetical protein